MAVNIREFTQGQRGQKTTVKLSFSTFTSTALPSVHFKRNLSTNLFSLTKATPYNVFRLTAQ